MKRPRETVLVAVGHESRINTLEESAVDAAAARVRAQADQIIGGTPAHFDGDADQARRDADQLLGKPARSFHALAPGGSELTWDNIVSTNRKAIAEGAGDPDAVSLDDLFEPAELARIDAEWAEFSTQLDTRLDEEALGALTASCRRAVIDAIVRPLGLGRLVARFDRTGGGVLTPHNADAARLGRLDGSELANQERLGSFHSRRAEEYAHKDYEGGFAAMRKERFKDPAPLHDAYAPDRELQRDGSTHLDHVIPAKQIHEDRDVNFFLTREEKRALANSEENLAFTNSALNQSKGDAKPSEWMDKERADGATNLEHYRADRAEGTRLEQRAEAHIAETLLSPRAKYYLAETAKAGAEDALKVGLQQAIGAVLVELAMGLFDEVSDLVRNGRQHDSLLHEFVRRAKRVGERVLESWRSVVEAFKQGALAGLLSAIVTAVINSIVTTGKRAIRIIREGVLSMLRAVRLLASPPAGMDSLQASHEASKLIAAAVAVSAGIAVEEAVEKSIVAAVPFLAPVAPVVSVVTVGLATGLSSVLLVAALDRVDFFGAVARERGDRRLMAMRERTDRLLDELLAQGST